MPIFAVSHEWCSKKKISWPSSWRVFEVDALRDDDVLNFAYWGTFKQKINANRVMDMETDHCYIEAEDEVEALKLGRDVIAAKYKKISDIGEVFLNELKDKYL